MNEGDLILAVDIGTGATKAVLFDAQLKPVSIVRKHYPISIPAKGWSEQEPETIFSAVLAAIRDSLALIPGGSRLRAIALSSQLYSVMAVGPDERALTNSIIWSDTRGAEAAGSLRKNPDAREVSQRTGCPIDSVYPLVKIKWLRENLLLPTDARFVSIKEYILHRLTGQWVVDWGIASATGIFDIYLHRWDPGAMALLGINTDNLSRLVSPRAVLNIQSREARERAGISEDIPLVIGGGDGQLASLSVAGESSDALSVNVGTSAAARAVIHQPDVDPQGRLWTYVVDEDLWVIGGMVSSGGIVFEWFLNNFISDEESSRDVAINQDLYSYVDRLAANIPPGAEDLLFIPYLSGAQAPDWLPRMRGSFTGIDLKHTRGHFSRAVLEGIARSIYRIAESIESSLDKHFTEVYATGGLTASAVWLQVAADMFGSVIIVPETSEGSARGAAMLAMLSLGMKSGIQDFQGLSTPIQKIYPDNDARIIYQEQKQKFSIILNSAKG